MFFVPVPAIIASEVRIGEALLPNEDLRTNADPLAPMSMRIYFVRTVKGSP
jgi:hypothetical protein